MCNTIHTVVQVHTSAVGIRKERGAVGFSLMSASSIELERAVSMSNRRSVAREEARPNLPRLTKHFDELVARMRTPDARAASDALFTDPAEMFGASALAAVKKPRG
ncbi:MAG: hypothetical protein DI536_24285 [Archangium gephyra]|uniref:Uncharacterized protein n=1 Tax=Archangium gephyra TaxID=48 RepID=A0A2W5TB47_9BACT|nr:MAG: hypothetical protein DI536_24285 [Archangium gephyra]